MPHDTAKIEVDMKLADVICDMDDIAFSEGLGPDDLPGRIGAWNALVVVAERVACRVVHRKRSAHAQKVVDSVCDRVVDALKEGWRPE